MKKFIVLIIFNLAMCSLTFAQSQIGFDKAKEIKLLESNRDDVRNIFAGYKSNTVKGSSHFDWFYTKNSEIKVTYSVGKCEDEDDSERHDVPEWKAEYIRITPNTPIKLKNIGIDLSKYKKEKKYKNVADLYLYYNKSEGIILNVRRDEIEGINFIPIPKYYPLLCNEKRAKVLSSTNGLFLPPLKERYFIPEPPAPSVGKLILNRTEIIANCDLSDSKQNKSCSDMVKTIDVFAIAKDSEGHSITYDYRVSSGKIIGKGAKVVWDLTGVKAGTYTITAAVDDGCGFCGAPKTKTVIVKECSKCR